MTREEAIKTLKGEAWICCFEKWNEALDMAIQALKQEPCEDTVSRQDVVNAVDKHTNEDGTLDNDITCILEDVPSVTPLDKIRAEIATPTNTSSDKDYDEGWEDAVKRDLNIIDKYRGERKVD